LGGNRSQYLEVYEHMVDDVIAESKKLDDNQVTIFDMLGAEEKKMFDEKLPDVEEYSKDIILQMEKDVLGVYISGHPLDDVKDIWKKNITATAIDFAYQDELEGSSLEDKSRVTVGGIISSVNTRLTKKKESMAIITIEDLTGTVEGMVFPKAYEKLRGKLIPDRTVFITGRVSIEDEGDSKLIVEDVCSFDDIPKTLWLKFEDLDKYNELWEKVAVILNTHKGIDTVKVRVIKEDKLKTLPSGMNVNADEELIALIEEVLGKGSAVIW
jgi:DNA polymerase-3 subunit alpha